jgi:hypothetical protein
MNNLVGRCNCGYPIYENEDGDLIWHRACIGYGTCSLNKKKVGWATEDKRESIKNENKL